jgi:aminoglycoside phosphotransferase (APT) family kinase protein
VSQPPPPGALDWVAEAVGRRIGAVAYLPGSSFHANHVIEVVGAEPVVLRRWTGAEWRATDAEFDAAREARVLELLAGSPVPAPRLLAADPDGERCGVPALLVTRLPGRPPGSDLAEETLLGELAALAAAIHSVDGARPIMPAYRRYVDPQRLAVPAWSRRTELWSEAIELARRPPPEGRACLIHRDLHPGNTLWEDGRLRGVVDWSYASWGPAAVDTAHLRWNLAVGLGSEAAEALLASGQALDHDPYWDVVDLLDLVGDPGTEQPDPPVPERLESYLQRVLG